MSWRGVKVLDKHTVLADRRQPLVLKPASKLEASLKIMLKVLLALALRQGNNEAGSGLSGIAQPIEHLSIERVTGSSPVARLTPGANTSSQHMECP